MGHYLKKHSLKNFKDTKMKSSILTFFSLGIGGAVAAGGINADVGRSVIDITQFGVIASLLHRNALFIYINDSYSSGGRILAIFAVAILGVGMSGGQQAGFASLVDLSNGDVVWFNYLNSTTGDLRTEEPALKTVELLLKDLPD